ncbi:MAG TPA: ABC transporter permease [Vicinamibacterales bacterium]|nr:ABC transporter permease [Vicinamibacterales bacterium]
MILRDLRSTLRLAQSRPLMTSAIVFMLTLGIGATTAIFSVVYGALLRPLPFPEADRLVQVYGSRPDRGWANVSLTEANFWDMRDRARAFADFGALHSTSFTLTGFEFPERVTGGQVSTGFFRALGVKPIAGRLLDPGEDERGRGEGLAVLSHAFWSRRFGTDRSIVGRPLTLSGASYLVIGILPPGSPWLDAADVFIPLIRRPDADRGSFEYIGIGRMKAGVTLEAATDDLRRVARELESAYPETNAGLGVAVQPSRAWIASDDLRRALWTLLAAAGLLLVIASVNVTNLLLARASTRERDSAVRTALGASRRDLVRERLIESLAYSAAGTTLGLALANAMLTTLKAANPAGVPRLNEVVLNTWAIIFAAGVAILIGVATGLIPALRIPARDLMSALRGGQRGATVDRGQQRVRNLFVAAEVALAIMLLVGAGLLVRSLVTVLSVERGFQTDDRFVFTITLPAGYGAPRIRELNRALLDRIQQIPDVVSAAAVSGRPLSRGSTGLGLAAADQPDTGSQVPWGTWRVVTTGYFKTMGLPLLAGRNFDERDEIGEPWRAVISKRVADLLWPGRNAIGRTIILWKGQNNSAGEVIGVVADMRERGLDVDPTLAVYFPANGSTMGAMQVVMQTRTGRHDVMPAVRTVVAGVDPTLPVSNLLSLDDIVSASVATRRMTMMLTVIFACLALVLALAGVYGVLAYMISQRTSEIGVRIALGAEHSRVLRLVFVQGMQPVLAGAAAGVGAMLWLSQFMAALLFGVQPRDAATYVAVLAAITVVGALACYVPARRVLRIDPATALRAE